jgi:predicted O-methyltransferase YrrM
MNLVRLVKFIFYTIITRALTTRRYLSRLQSENDDVLRSLVDVLENRCLQEEMEWIRRIEILKKKLCASSTKISIADYGAGSTKFGIAPRTEPQGGIIVKTIGDVCRKSTRPHKWNFLLFRLIREFRPLVCLELGTALGISAAYQAAALELNRQGKIITLEGAESLASLARSNFKELDLSKTNVVIGRFLDTLQDVLIKNAPIDFVFIDGHHEEYATLNYFKQILPSLSDGAVLVFDDISWSRGMERAWNIIRKNRNLKVSVDLFSVGICIYSKLTVENTKYFKIAI